MKVKGKRKPKDGAPAAPRERRAAEHVDAAEAEPEEVEVQMDIEDGAAAEGDRSAGKRKSMATAFAKILGKKSKSAVPILAVSQPSRAPHNLSLSYFVFFDSPRSSAHPPCASRRPFSPDRRLCPFACCVPLAGAAGA